MLLGSCLLLSGKVRLTQSQTVTDMGVVTTACHRSYCRCHCLSLSLYVAASVLCGGVIVRIGLLVKHTPPPMCPSFGRLPLLITAPSLFAPSLCLSVSPCPPPTGPIRNRVRLLASRLSVAVHYHQLAALWYSHFTHCPLPTLTLTSWYPSYEHEESTAGC